MRNFHQRRLHRWSNSDSFDPELNALNYSGCIYYLLVVFPNFSFSRASYYLWFKLWDLWQAGYRGEAYVAIPQRWTIKQLLKSFYKGNQTLTMLFFFYQKMSWLSYRLFFTFLHPFSISIHCLVYIYIYIYICKFLDFLQVKDS